MTNDHQIVLQAINQLGGVADAKSLLLTVKRVGNVSADVAADMIGAALAGRVLLENRGQVRKAPSPRDSRGPSEARILDLEGMGYTVQEMYDGDPPLYGWICTLSGSSQGILKDRQPYRRTRAQAWDDCDAYVSGSVPSVASPDWRN